MLLDKKYSVVNAAVNSNISPSSVAPSQEQAIADEMAHHATELKKAIAVLETSARNLIQHLREEAE